MKIILLGAPGAGKGTQAEFLCEKYSIPAISTGNIIRDALKSGSELGEYVRPFINSGRLVPDKTVVNLVRDRLSQSDCNNGFILDGFPRTIPQAEALDYLNIIIDRVVELELTDNEIIKRVSGRRICEDCGASYHLIFRKSKREGICDICTGTLIQREDDTKETVIQRLKVYHNTTEPLKRYYEKQNKLIIVNGKLKVNEISKKIEDELEAS